ncbi:MAG: peptide MFS transporter, partial [Henriciella sp.]
KATETIAIDGATYELTRAEYDESQSRNIVVDGVTAPILTFEQPEKGSDIRNISYELNGQTVEATGTIDRVQDPLYTMILFLALAFIVAGVGFLKPNISTCVGALYEEGDRRRDAGFTIYYMGINLGSFLAGILCAIAAATLGWWAGFGLAAVGMLAGLFVFVIGQDWLEGRAEPPAGVDLKTPVFAGLNREWLVYLAGLAFVAVSFGLLQIAGLMSLAMHGVFAVVTTGIVFYMLTRLEPVARDKMIGLLILIVSSVLFWALFDQGPSSLNLFAASHVTNEIGGWEFPAPVLQSANPLFIIIFAPIVAALWTFLGKRGKEPNAFIKFGLAMIQIGAGFYVLNLGIAGASEGADGTIKISVIFIVLMYLLHTTGEVFLSPVGLSAVTKLSVKTIVGFMMGFWFLASSYANVIAAQVARATQVPEGAPAQESIDAYSAVYAQLGTSAVALGVILLVASPFLRKLTHGADGNGQKEKRAEVDAAGVAMDRTSD